MKTAKLNVAFSVFIFAAWSARAQSTFQNLNFEDANPVVVNGSPYYPYGVTATSALPDWTVTYGSAQQSQITEDDPSTGSTWVSIVTPGYGAIDGNYSVLLQGGITASAATISQTALIPVSSQSLLFEEQSLQGPVNPQLGPGTFAVSIGGQSVPFEVLASGPNYTLYGANISTWAGQSNELSFSALEGQLNNYVIDDISFSTTPVPSPEPSIVALTAIGGLLFGIRKWLARRRS